MHTKSYKNLWPMLAIHFVIMFAVMYTMVDNLSDVYVNLNQVYMTGMMVAPMAIIMLLLMSSMYDNKRLNYAVYVGSIVVFVLFFGFMRSQALVGDKQFVRSMIPHHSGAILMCEKARLADPELKRLCAQIKDGQKKEIDQMKGILERL